MIAPFNTDKMKNCVVANLDYISTEYELITTLLNVVLSKKIPLQHENRNLRAFSNIFLGIFQYLDLQISYVKNRCCEAWDFSSWQTEDVKIKDHHVTSRIFISLFPSLMMHWGTG